MATKTDVVMMSILGLVAKQLRIAQTEVLDTIGEVVANRAAQYAPVDTGLLRSSYTHYVTPSKEEVTIGTHVDYAPYQEFGTGRTGAHSKHSKTPPNYRHGPSKGHRAQPHLEPAMMDTLPLVKEIARRGFTRIGKVTDLSVRQP